MSKFMPTHDNGFWVPQSYDCGTWNPLLCIGMKLLISTHLTHNPEKQQPLSKLIWTGGLGAILKHCGPLSECRSCRCLVLKCNGEWPGIVSFYLPHLSVWSCGVYLTLIKLKEPFWLQRRSHCSVINLAHVGEPFVAPPSQDGAICHMAPFSTCQALVYADRNTMKVKSILESEKVTNFF